MRKAFILCGLCLLGLSASTGCHTKKNEKSLKDPRDLLNQYTLGDCTFDSAHLLDVVEYVESEINKQSDVKWRIEIKQDENDIRSIRGDELENWFKYSATLKNDVGAGTFLEILTLRTFTKYEIDGHVVVISRRLH